MPLLNYPQIVTLIKKTRTCKQSAFSPEDYLSIVRSCEHDRILRHILSAYPPLHFKRLYQSAREHVLAAAQRTGEHRVEMMNVHDPLFAAGRNLTKIWLLEQTEQLNMQLTETYIQSAEKEVLGLLELLCKDGFLEELYSERSSEQLTEIVEDFKVFVKYLFRSYAQGATGLEHLMKAIAWAQGPHKGITQADALKSIFSSLNEARTGYEFDPHKFIKKNHPFAEGQHRDWSCMPGVDERLIDGLMPFRLSCSFTAGEGNESYESSFAESYVQLLVHDFIQQRPHGLRPSPLLYSLYIQGILPEGWTCFVRKDVVFKLQFKAGRCLEQAIEDYAFREYKKILALGTKLFGSLDEESLLSLLYQVLHDKPELDYTVLQELFPSIGHQPLLIRAQVKHLLSISGFLVNAHNLSIQPLWHHVKKALHHNADLKIKRALEASYETANEATHIALTLGLEGLVITPDEKEILAFKDTQGMEQSTELLSLETLSKESLQNKIQQQAGLTEEWLDLLNAVFHREGADAWDLCRNLLDQKDPSIYKTSVDTLDSESVLQHTRASYQALVALGQEYLADHNGEFFYYYAFDGVLVVDLTYKLYCLLDHLNDHGRDFYREIILPFQDNAVVGCLRSGLWEMLNSHNKIKLLFWLAAQNYKNSLTYAGINVNQEDYEGNTPLILAAQHNSLDALQILLQRGACVHHKNKCGNTPLMLAILKGHVDVIELLIAAHAPLNDAIGGYTPLMLAVRCGSLSVVRRLLACPDLSVNQRNKTGHTALMLAAQDGHTEIFNELLQHTDINVDDKNDVGYSALIFAAGCGHLAITQLLLKRPDVDINQESHDGKTALITATRRGYLEIIRELIDHGANINHQARYGDTALMLATLCGHITAVECLLSCSGIQVNQKTRDGTTALILAARRRYQIVFERLIQAKADVNCVDKQGDTVLKLAARAGHVDMLEILLQEGAEIDHQDEHGYTALTWAVSNDQECVVEKLLRAGACVDPESANGMTPLMIAVQYSFCQVAAQLLCYGANLERPNAAGVSAFSMMMASSSIDLIKMALHFKAREQPILHTAILLSAIEVVNKLLSHGEDVHQRDHLGNTPLHIAVEMRSSLLVTVLLTAQADPLLKNHAGKNAFDITSDEVIRELLNKASYFSQHKEAPVEALLLSGGGARREDKKNKRKTHNS